MAALPQCFSYHCCIESLGKLPPKGFGQHTVNVSAILRILLWIVCLAARAVGSTWATGAAARTQGGAATAATGLRKERGAAGEASAQRSQQRQTTGRPPSSPEKWTKESSAERRCERWEDRLSDCRGTGLAAPVPRSNGGRRCAGQFGGRGSARRPGGGCGAARHSRGASTNGARTGAGGGELSTTLRIHLQGIRKEIRHLRFGCQSRRLPAPDDERHDRTTSGAGSLRLWQPKRR